MLTRVYKHRRLDGQRPVTGLPSLSFSRLSAFVSHTRYQST
jgi:hypothetical protein